MDMAAIVHKLNLYTAAINFGSEACALYGALGNLTFSTCTHIYEINKNG